MTAPGRPVAEYDPRVAYDERLADRIRELLAPTPDVTEQKMFGGLAFLVRGHLAITASSEGGLLVRVGPVAAAALAARTTAEVALMGTRTMAGWLRVDATDVRTRRQLSRWVDAGVAFAGALPPKSGSPTRRRASA